MLSTLRKRVSNILLERENRRRRANGEQEISVSHEGQPLGLVYSTTRNRWVNPGEEDLPEPEEERLAPPPTGPVSAGPAAPPPPTAAAPAPPPTGADALMAVPAYQLRGRPAAKAKAAAVPAGPMAAPFPPPPVAVTSPFGAAPQPQPANAAAAAEPPAEAALMPVAAAAEPPTPAELEVAEGDATVPLAPPMAPTNPFAPRVSVAAVPAPGARTRVTAENAAEVAAQKKAERKAIAEAKRAAQKKPASAGSSSGPSAATFAPFARGSSWLPAAAAEDPEVSGTAPPAPQEPQPLTGLSAGAEANEEAPFGAPVVELIAPELPSEQNAAIKGPGAEEEAPAQSLPALQQDATTSLATEAGGEEHPVDSTEPAVAELPAQQPPASTGVANTEQEAPEGALVVEPIMFGATMEQPEASSGVASSATGDSAPAEEGGAAGVQHFSIADDDDDNVVVVEGAVEPTAEQGAVAVQEFAMWADTEQDVIAEGHAESSSHTLLPAPAELPRLDTPQLSPEETEGSAGHQEAHAPAAAGASFEAGEGEELGHVPEPEVLTGPMANGPEDADPLDAAAEPLDSVAPGQQVASSGGDLPTFSTTEPAAERPSPPAQHFIISDDDDEDITAEAASAIPSRNLLPPEQPTPEIRWPSPEETVAEDQQLTAQEQMQQKPAQRRRLVEERENAAMAERSAGPQPEAEAPATQPSAAAALQGPKQLNPQEPRRCYEIAGDDGAEEAGDIPFHDLSGDEALPEIKGLGTMSIAELFDQLAAKWRSPKAVQQISEILELHSFEADFHGHVVGHDRIDLLIKVLRQHAEASEEVLRPAMCIMASLMLSDDLVSSCVQAGVMDLLKGFLAREGIHRVKGLVVKALHKAVVSDAERLSLGRALADVKETGCLGSLLYTWLMKSQDPAVKAMVRGLSDRLTDHWGPLVKEASSW